MRKRRRKKTLFNTQQRFGIRKFVIGTAFVLIDLGLVGAKQVNTVLVNGKDDEPSYRQGIIGAATKTDKEGLGRQLAILNQLAGSISDASTIVDMKERNRQLGILGTKGLTQGVMEASTKIDEAERNRQLEAIANNKIETLKNDSTGIAISGSHKALNGAERIEIVRLADAITPALQGKEYDLYDINLYNAAGEKVQITAPVTVTIPTTKQATAVYYVLLDAAENLAISNATATSVSFEVSHFSEYAVVYGETKLDVAPILSKVESVVTGKKAEISASTMPETEKEAKEADVAHISAEVTETINTAQNMEEAHASADKAIAAIGAITVSQPQAAPQEIVETKTEPTQVTATPAVEVTEKKVLPQTDETKSPVLYGLGILLALVSLVGLS